MKTTIDNTQRKFFICKIGWSSDSYVCNLKDIEKVVKDIADSEPYKIYHLWNNRLQALSKKEVNEMLEANGLDFRFRYSQKFKIKFTGREARAIGKFSKYTLNIVAQSEAEALMQVYNTHDHLTNVTINGKPVK